MFLRSKNEKDNHFPPTSGGVSTKSWLERLIQRRDANLGHLFAISALPFLPPVFP